jgi:hypothetical protein
MWNSAIGRYYTDQGYDTSAAPVWNAIHEILCRELGVFRLGKADGDTPSGACKEYILKADTDGALSIIELSFRIIDRVVREFDSNKRHRAVARFGLA